MLDPRIYRTGLVAVAMAVIVFAFSLQDMPGGFGTSLVPDAFSESHAAATMTQLASRWPDRRPGSDGDRQLAQYVAEQLAGDGFQVSRADFSAHTAFGTQVLENVWGTLAGASDSTIVIVAHRDAAGTGATSDLSGTAVLLELARVLKGESARHTIVLASTTATAGAAGAAQLTRDLPGPVDAVLVLGDLAPARVHQPLVVPWSNGQTVAPMTLRRTVAWALGAQGEPAPAMPGLGGQLLHLAFPLALGEQAPFNDAGIPSVLISGSGEEPPSANELSTPAQLAAGQAQLQSLGRTVLQSVNALDAGAAVPAPSTYVLYDRKVIPVWAIRLLALALILPVAITALDGLARAGRRGYGLGRLLGWALSWALAFVLAAIVIVLARVVGLLSSAPAGAVPPGSGGPHGGGVATLVVAGLVAIAAVAFVRRWLMHLAFGSRGKGDYRGGGVAVTLVLCAVALVIWVRNPFAALLLVPALHLSLWFLAAELPLPRVARLAGALLGFLGPIGAAVYYGVSLRLAPSQVMWNGVLLLARGQISPLTALEWSVAFGCLVGSLVVAWRLPGREHEEPVAITVRGPLTYAGPGSLGGTGSAIRR
ncbi:MAG TPA: M28 family peptidase [Solirubrobacteraceae bacterium]|nr:M28 family peptidase [Solirubrobacteraceae bacterium]